MSAPRPNPAGTAREKEIQIPEWENAAIKNDRSREKPSTVGVGIGRKFDAILPPHRRYLGLRRRVFLWVLLAVLLALVALIIGLAVGLTQRSNSSKDLPLPSNSHTFTGDLTYYQPALGACGETSSDDDDIVAISHLLFDAAGTSSSSGGNSNNNPLCFQKLRASRFDEEHGAQRSVDLKVVDRCTGCALDDLDTSLGAFDKLAPSASGRVDVTWAWLQAVQTG